MKHRRILAWVLALLLLPLSYPLPGRAAGPVQVAVTVDKTSVRVGETITVNWTVSGGTAVDHSMLVWADIWPEDVRFRSSFEGGQGIAKLTVREGMSPVIRFQIHVYDGAGIVSFGSDDLGKSVTNLDGWKHGSKDFYIRLDKQAVKPGETVTATVTQKFSVGQGTYLGFDYQWFTGDSHVSTEPATAIRTASSGQYARTFTFTPYVGTFGYLEVSAQTMDYEAGGPDHFYSDDFTIMDAGTPTCAIALDRAEVSTGETLAAEYSMQNHDGGNVVTRWEFREEGKTETETLGESSSPPSGRRTIVFDRPGVARFGVDSLYGSFEGTWQEYTPNFWSDWITVKEKAGLVPLSLSSSVEVKTAYTVSLPVAIGWDIQGGTAPYQLEYILKGRYDGEAYMSNAAAPVTLSQAAAGPGSARPVLTNYPGPNGEVYVKVTDANGVTREATSPFYTIVEPVIAKATAGDGYVDLSWNPYPHSTDFSVYRYQNGTFTLLAEEIGGLSYRVGNLPNGQMVHLLVRLRDYNAYSDLHPSFVVSATPHAPGGKVPGDAEGDTDVDLQDLLIIINHIIAGAAIPNRENADANGDSQVDIKDLTWVIDQIAGR